MGDVAWHSVTIAPIVLLHGSEGLLVDRAVERLRNLAYTAHPDTTVTRIESDAYAQGGLTAATSPSLFGEPRLIIITNMQTAPDALLSDLNTYRTAPEADVTLVVIHRGGNRGKKVLDALRGSGIPRVPCEPMKRVGDRQVFVTSEFTRAGRRIREDAAAALVDAFSQDLAELAATCRQIIADTEPEAGEEPPVIDRAAVHSVVAGRVETTAFAVADAAIAGRDREALALLRQASSSGVDPVPMVAAIASKIRGLAKVSTPGASAKTLGMPDWMVRNLKREAQAWSDRGLARAIEATARADHDVKGASRDPAFAVQRAVLEICRARRDR
ncbi:DNA polymerase III subunit delta [Devriesea agamarum]|uniref:DNA polymerase III subunit delta n=1 Tax=Devriesea agamarum TaxID=472569 RepID=UPI00071DA0EB|nr:DNA polymerase III subunit delta [Devriesea agamarum]